MSQRTAKVVAVTGATSGIGRAVATALAEGGHTVVLIARSLDLLALVEAECQEAGAATLAIEADVRSAAQVQDAMDLVVERFGQVDAVVHSAGVITYGTFETVPADVFDDTVATTFTGAANVARSAVRRFRVQGHGHLVLVGSLLGHIAAPYMGSYVTSKWAVHALARVLAIELRDVPGVHCSLVSPGGVDTAIYRQAGTYLSRHGTPPPPVAAPAEVADRILAVLQQPRRESQVGWANLVTIAGFRALPAVFDRLVSPLMRTFALGPLIPMTATTGNVRQPSSHNRPAQDGPGHTTEGATMSSASSLDGQATRAAPELEDKPPVSRLVAAPDHAVWAVLSDGWTYATWVVGTSRIRDVHLTWPAEGSRIYHSVGLWPALISDFTAVDEVLENRLLVLTARGWPLGEAKVTITITPTDSVSCVVTMREDAVSGPGALIPAPVRQVAIRPRNVEALHRLAMMAEGRYRHSDAASRSSHTMKETPSAPLSST